ncbi:MAG: DNA translocase FtsK [bacterium]|nr:DNA translocase FtsK [bacterium]
MKRKKANNFTKKSRWLPSFALPQETKKWIWGVVAFILAIIFGLSFFGRAGVAGNTIFSALTFLLGRTVFIIPLVFVLAGFVFFKTQYEKCTGPIILGALFLLLGFTGLWGSFTPGEKYGGFLGFIFSKPFLNFFGDIAAKVIFLGISLIGGLIFWHIARPLEPKTKEEKKLAGDAEETSLIKKIFAPRFNVKEIEPRIKEEQVKEKESAQDLKIKSQRALLLGSQYKIPPLELLEVDKGKPLAGDTITNSAIIKKTLENFDLKVEMSEINIGPTVTQYAFKPAEGIKLSKITGLNNNLSLALASHPIRIEAPIPGKSLVGIEVPNKERCKVRLRDLMADPGLQRTGSSLTVVLGRDVSGNPCYADLTRMPHLLVAGSTGTGKTIFLNNLILSLLYQNSPEILRLILVDPKRVEFSAFHDIPHLLAPVIFDAQKTINALRWLVLEMERRFGVLSSNGSRDITSYNSKMSRDGGQILPCIVLIIDELADLMAAKGREMEAGIVRLSQMARAVGIHLVVATQRPSVEVITGLIKANITSRITFQVASQVDSRTVLDAAGAEKLLGLGDLLFISAEVVKPKRIQGPFVSEKEVKRVVDFIKAQKVKIPETEAKNSVQRLEEAISGNHLSLDLEKSLEAGEAAFADSPEEDPLYLEAKKIVIEAKKASASLLQRRLRIGYARAARLLDTLEEQGVVGPGEGARPREILVTTDGGDGEEAEWQKV